MSIARALREARLPYMVVGAHAAMVYGYARLSSDIDFVVHLPPADERRVESVLRDLGFSEIERRKDEWGRRLVVETDGLEVEIFLTPPNAVYDREYARRTTIEYRGEIIPFLSAEDVIIRKLVNTRLRRGHDFDDVVGILIVQRGKLDMDYIQAHSAFYRVTEMLERALKEADAAES